MSEPLACPCCGHKTLQGPYGSHDLCPVCCWEDDPAQLADPTLAGGPNAPSLTQAQANYFLTDASNPALIPHVRRPGPLEPKDHHWRFFDPAVHRTGHVTHPMRPYWLD